MPFVDNAVKPPVISNVERMFTENSYETEIDGDAFFSVTTGEVYKDNRDNGTNNKVNEKRNLSNSFPDIFW